MPQRIAFALPNSTDPVSGPVGLNVPLDFTGGDNIAGDLSLEQQQSVIEYVQSIYINNFANAKLLTLVFAGLQYTISVPAGRWGVFPVIIPAGKVSWTAQSVGAGLIVPTIMFNAKMPYFEGGI